MNNKIVMTLLGLVTYVGFAQVGIGTTTPDASAVLELNSTNSGFLLPNVSLTSLTDITTIPNPVEGLMVYNPSSNSAHLAPGVYVFDGIRWGIISLDYGTSSAPTYPRLIKDEIGVNNVAFSTIHAYLDNGYGNFASLFDGVDNTGAATCHIHRNVPVSQTPDWGFVIQLPQAYTIKQVALEGRNDCCTQRIENVFVQLYLSGNLVYASNPITSATIDLNTFNVPNIFADEIRLMVPNGGLAGTGTVINFTELEVVAQD